MYVHLEKSSSPFIILEGLKVMAPSFEEFTKSADYKMKEQSLISWCRNDNRKKARVGKVGWQPK